MLQRTLDRADQVSPHGPSASSPRCSSSGGSRFPRRRVAGRGQLDRALIRAWAPAPCAYRSSRDASVRASRPSPDRAASLLDSTGVYFYFLSAPGKPRWLCRFSCGGWPHTLPSPRFGEEGSGERGETAGMDFTNIARTSNGQSRSHLRGPPSPSPSSRGEREKRDLPHTIPRGATTL